MDQENYPFRICDVILPECNTGYVYMLLSIKDKIFTYIGMKNCIQTKLQAHNSGYGSSSTEPVHLHPYALFAYICGFDGRRDLMFHVEHAWKVKRNDLIRNGNNDVTV